MTLTTVQTSQSVLGRDEAWLTDTVVTGVSVDTAPVVTVVLTSLTFILVLTLLLGVHDGASWTNAGEGPHSVLTFSSVAEPWNSLTLVYIHTLAGVNIFQEA